MTEQERQDDKRRYVRLETVVPVDFTIVRLQGDLPGLSWQRGRTRNVSQEGLGLETDHLDESTIVFLSKEQIYLDVRLHVAGHKPLKAVCEVVWHEPLGSEETDRYLLGLKFRSIAAQDLRILIGRARWKNIWRKMLSWRRGG